MVIGAQILGFGAKYFGLNFTGNLCVLSLETLFTELITAISKSVNVMAAVENGSSCA